MSNQTLAKTKFVQTDNERYSSEELFYSQLTREEKIEYNDLMIRNLKGCQEDYRGQIYLHNFPQLLFLLFQEQLYTLHQIH